MTSGVSSHAFRDAFARDRVISQARDGWLGQLAREVGLGGELKHVYDRRNQVELAIYRAHHARAVVAASPLALDLLAHLDSDADALVWSLRPRGEWRRWVCGLWPHKSAYLAHSAGRPPLFPSDDLQRRELFLHGCSVAREWSDPAGAIGVRLGPVGLEIGARIGPLHLRTLGDVAMITTALPIPHSARIAALGLHVERLFDHPILRGRGYVVSDQYDRVPTRDDPREAWRIEFKADPVRWRVPWSRARARHGGDHGGDRRADDDGSAALVRMHRSGTT